MHCILCSWNLNSREFHELWINLIFDFLVKILLLLLGIDPDPLDPLSNIYNHCTTEILQQYWKCQYLYSTKYSLFHLFFTQIPPQLSEAPWTKWLSILVCLHMFHPFVSFGECLPTFEESVGACFHQKRRCNGPGGAPPRCCWWKQLVFAHLLHSCRFRKKVRTHVIAPHPPALWYCFHWQATWFRELQTRPGILCSSIWYVAGK